MGLSSIFRGRYALVLAAGCLLMRGGGHAQHLAATTSTATASARTLEVATSDAVNLPDAPQPVASSSSATNADVTATDGDAPYGGVTEVVTYHRKPASKYRLVVKSDEVVPTLTSGEKIRASLQSRISLGGLGATIFAAGFSQMRDGSPHYGTDTGAFGERLGGIALKQTSSSFFSYGVYASLAHTDPRYYVMGPRESITRRAVYSASRVVVTRSDSGHDRINWPKLAGIATATALTNLYYPTADHGFGNSVKAFGASVGSSALTYELHEFLGDAFHAVRGR